MSMPSRLAAAATVLALVVFSAACTERIVIQTTPGNGRGRARPPQVVASDPVAPLAPGFLRCDGIQMRVGDSIVCFDEAQRTWQQAEDHCMQIGGHLARISSAAQSQALSAAFGAPLKLPGTLWIGLVEPFREGEWGWMTGKRTSYSNWNGGEPNDSGGSEDCGEWLTGSGMWNDIDCGALRVPLCEGTPPAKGVKSSFNCTGSFFQVGDTPYCLYSAWEVTAAQAEQVCKTTGGHLAELSTPEKDKALFAALRPRAGSGADVWIGFTDARKEGDWRYLSGEPASFTGWRQGEPNNVGASGEDCATWGPVDGGWNDLACESKAQSLCEGPAEPAEISCSGPLAFTVPGCTNIAPGSTAVTASASSPGSAPDKATDSDCATSWNAGGGPSQYLQIDLGAAQDIRGVTLSPNMTPATAAVAHDISVSSDGTVFRTVIHYEGLMTSGQIYPLDFGSPVKARQVRVTTLTSPSWISWQEVAVFRCPSP